MIPLPRSIVRLFVVVFRTAIDGSNTPVAVRRSPLAVPVSPLSARPAYTLLELMIALGLLGALLSVAWSLMGTYRDAEQRGWKVASRTQTIRAARNWLEGDLQHLATGATATFQIPSPLANSSATSTSRFEGTHQGFSATIAPSLDPLPFLERLMSNASADAADAAFSDANTPGLESAIYEPSSPWPAERLEVEYRLSPLPSSVSTGRASLLNESASSLDTHFALTRRELLETGSLTGSGWGDDAAANNASERVLTAQDLYRQEPQESFSQAVAVREARLEGLLQPKFQYSDGQAWKSQWNSQTEGGWPTAIALSFNFPARADMRRPQPRTVGDNSDLENVAAAEDSAQFAFADTALAAEPLAELGNTEGGMSLTPSGSHEVQIVILIGDGSPMQPSRQQPFGSGVDR